MDEEGALIRRWARRGGAPHGYGVYAQDNDGWEPKELNFPGFDTEFHTYGLYWSPERLIFYVDNKPVFRVEDPKHVPDVPQHFLFNVSLSGNGWGNSPDKSNPTMAQIIEEMPNSMEIDCFRAYSGTLDEAVPVSSTDNPLFVRKYSPPPVEAPGRHSGCLRSRGGPFSNPRGCGSGGPGQFDHRQPVQRVKMWMKMPALVILMMLSVLLSSRGEIPESGAPAIFRALQAGKPQTVIVYGTSLTHGGQWAVATKEWFDQAYPGQAKFINSGGPGQNSDWGLANLKTKVLDHHPDLVFIEFSYNDAHEKFKMPVARGASNLVKIVDAIREQNPETTIVLQIMNVGWDAPNGRGSLSNRPKLELYNDNYRNMTGERHLQLLDHYVAWKNLKDSDQETYQRYIPDGTHPEPEGSLAVTWPVVKAWLEASRAAASGRGLQK